MPKHDYPIRWYENGTKTGWIIVGEDGRGINGNFVYPKDEKAKAQRLVDVIKGVRSDS